MKSILIIVRTEADFERAIAIGIAGKNKYEQHFVFTGDFSPFYFDGIQNKFQKELFVKCGFQIHDFSEFDLLGRVLRKLSKSKSISFAQLRENKKLLLTFIFFVIFKKYILKSKKRIIKSIFKKVNPSFLVTDQSMTDINYLPQQIRAEAIERNIPVSLFTHGAAGGLHSEFSKPSFLPYKDCTVYVCNKNETRPEIKNRVILGDISSSFPYVHFLNSQNFEEINFLNDRKYKIAFMIGGTAAFTSTSGWLIQEEIIIELSENKDVAMVLKVHPRDTDLNYLKMVEQFDNLLIVKNETDRSRVSKWADIVICNDHCSTVFEPMILGKKVIAVSGKHLPKFKNNHSPLINSSVLFISSSNEFDLDKIPSANPGDAIMNEICWGGHGNVDLAKLFHERISQIVCVDQNVFKSN